MAATPGLLFGLHFLGGSSASWAWAAADLPADISYVGIDLPGFGTAASTPGYSVSQMADHVARTISRTNPTCWAIAGHSMGAKVALAVVRRAEDGEAGLAGLSRLVLLAGSPPVPEPMRDAARSRMLGWFVGPAGDSRKQARTYINENSGVPLPDERQRVAEADLLRMAPAAWHAWLASGSLEDWSSRISVLRTPALILAGAKDSSLGEAVQRSLMAPHLAHSTLIVLPGAGHLLPLERPAEVARLIVRHLRADDPRLSTAPAIDDAYTALIASNRVSPQLRAALDARAVPDDPAYTPAAMSVEHLATLRAVLHRVVPQDPPGIDLAARIDRQLADGVGDGWRFAALPTDVTAWQAALTCLNMAAQSDRKSDFAALAPRQQDRLLARAARGKRVSADAPLDAAALQLWFQDLCGLAARLYVAHPATLGRMGYSGIANGGPAPALQGFSQLGIGEREPWEPAAPRCP